MTSKTFDIGQSDNLAIFTNDSDDDVFSNKDGPNFLLSQGNEINLSDTGNIDNLVSDIKIEFPDDSPLDFIKSKNESGQRHKMDSYSSASSSTIEAEPVITRPKVSSPPKQTQTRPVSSQVPKQNSFQQTQKTPESNILENFNFDEILDNKKLKKTEDVLSMSGDSQSTIKGFDYIQEQKPRQQQNDNRHQQSHQQENTYTQATEYKPEQENEAPKYINEDEEKLDLLLKLQALEKRQGIKLSRKYTLQSSLEEIKMEYKHQSSILETEASVKFMKKGLVFCTSGIEYMNRRFDPVGAKLDGWGESIMENIMDYDGIFERLHEKYKGTGKMEPEMELIFALGGSAFMFHLTQTMFKQAVPQFGNVMRENPDLMKGIFGAVQEATARSKQTPPQQNVPLASNYGSAGQMESPNINFGAMLSQMGIGNNQTGFERAFSNGPPPPIATKDINEPLVTDIYRKMTEKETDILSNTSIDSETSISSGNRKAIISPSKRKNGGRVLKL